MVKKILCAITIMIALVCVLASCGHKHNWQPETCETPKTCVDCEITEGQPLGHAWVDASCTTPKSCANCNAQQAINCFQV